MYNIEKVQLPPKIDGDLSDRVWSNLNIAKDFSQISPNNGTPEKQHQRTEVKICYDNKNIYFGVMMYDNAPDSILREISTRDAENKNFDGFGLFIDPFNDSQVEYNFMVTEARGLICVPMLAKNIDRLELPMQAQKNTVPHYTAFTVSVDAAQQISTGISASDRALTIKLLANPSSKPSQFVQPGHVFPLKYHPGGVLVRAGHTEGSIDLIKLANKNPAAIVCEILNDDGTMARGNQLEKLSKKHDIPIVSIADIISYRMTHETLVKRVAETVIPTKYGKFNFINCWW